MPFYVLFSFLKINYKHFRVFANVILFSSLTLMLVSVFSVHSFIEENWKGACPHKGQRRKWTVTTNYCL